MPTHKTAGGHRRYLLRELQSIGKSCGANTERIVLAYARVSSSDQRDDLERQSARLENYCNSKAMTYQVIRDLGSGMNYKKRGLKKLLGMIITGQVDRLILTHKDRLLRFGAEIIFYLCSYFGTTVEIIEADAVLSDEETLVRDVLEIITIFSSRLYGKRAHKKKVS